MSTFLMYHISSWSQLSSLYYSINYGALFLHTNSALEWLKRELAELSYYHLLYYKMTSCNMTVLAPTESEFSQLKPGEPGDGIFNAHTLRFMS